MKRRKELWQRELAGIYKDCIRVRIPRAHLSMLSLLFHHVSDAMAGDDRPDHGLAMMRKGLEFTRGPFDNIFWGVERAYKRMTSTQRTKAARLYSEYLDAKRESDQRWRAELLQRTKNQSKSA